VQPAYLSGHTSAVFDLAATVAVLLPIPQSAKAAMLRRPEIRAAGCVARCVVAVCVDGGQLHNVTDTLAGAAVGIGTVFGFAFIVDLRAVRQPLAVPTALESRVG
jgi:hypothetical protein